MALEYIDEILQTDYTISGATDEAYPAWDAFTVYPKTTKVIHENKIYEANKTVALPTYYVYSKTENSLYIPSTASFLTTASFSPTNEFEERFIFLDDTDTLYKYIGATTTTIIPSTEDFTDTLKWENKGVQLNGYTSVINTPSTSPFYWKDSGNVNSRRAFDNRNSSQTISDVDTNLVYVFQTGNVDRIACFNLLAKEIIVKTKLGLDPESPANTQTQTITLYSQTGTNFYDIIYSPIVFNKTAYIKIPTAGTQEITITIVPAGRARIGDLTLGKAKTLGATLDGVSYDIKDYSSYGSDSSASDTYIEGGYRKVNDFTVSYETPKVGIILDQLDSLRGKITVFNLDDKSNDDHLKIKGFMRGRPLDYLSNNERGKINIKVEGRLE